MEIFNNWFILALIAPALWAFVVIVDDNLISKVYNKSPLFGTIITGYFGSLPLFLIPFNFVQIPPVHIMLLGIISGSIVILSFWLYFKALTIELPSIVAAMWNLYPALVPLIAYVFLKEKLELFQYIGLGIILVSSVIISALDLEKFKISRAFYLMSASSLLLAVDSITQKYIYNTVDFYSGYIFVCVGMVLTGIILSILFKEGRQFYPLFKKKAKKYLWIFVSSEVLNVVASFVSSLAVSKAPVSLVKTIEGIQPIYMLFIAVVLYPLWPNYFRDALSKNKVKKIILMVVMIIGLYLIYK